MVPKRLPDDVRELGRGRRERCQRDLGHECGQVTWPLRADPVQLGLDALAGHAPVQVLAACRSRRRKRE